ncbi:MAG TPA: hypoxanthine phosphoribosyltransferase [Nitrospirota bacterium]|nr:hypoxanthine phosphoribosyltransferase [Nitrospirota bacterium]
MPEIKRVLFDQDVIAARVEALAQRISTDYAGKELVLICILKAAAIFAADLMRRLSVSAKIEFIQAASYGMSAASSREVVIVQDLHKDIENRHILLVDTIIDTGHTLHALLGLLAERKPASMNIVVLLDKKSRRSTEVPVAYCGFEVPDEFVVGYGMDYRDQYRTLPYIAIVEPGE